MFIKLTQHSTFRLPGFQNLHGRVIHVAVDKIAYLHENRRGAIDSLEDQKIPEVARRQESFTTVVFNFGGPDGTECLDVSEPVETILLAINNIQYDDLVRLTDLKKGVI